jgi:lipopolysaccharide/colanic/teichoic acid biosynthesis glycosyltransferase
LVVAVALRLGPERTLEYLVTFKTQLLLVLAVYGAVLVVSGVTSGDRRQDPIHWMVGHVGAHMVAWLISLALVYFQGLDRPGRGILVLFAGINALLFTVTGLIVRHLATRVMPKQRAIVIGSGKFARPLIDALAARVTSPWRPVAVLDVGDGGAEDWPEGCNIYRHADELQRIVEKERAECLILVPPYNPDGELYYQIARCRLGGLGVHDAVEIYEHLEGRIPLELVTDHVALLVTLMRVAPVNVVAKRALDIGLSAALLVLLAPIMCLTALAIRLLDGAPVLFKQERLGLEGKPFSILKFRTMVREAEATTGPVMAWEGDPRVTPIGRVLRRWRLDELPQLMNVLRGDMSLVGPRPEREAFVRDFRRRVPVFRLGRRKDDPVGTVVYDGWREAIHAYSVRLLVRPGLTGWAQVRSPYGGSVEEKREHFEYDLFYMKNQSLLFDIAILCRTPLALFCVAGR